MPIIIKVIMVVTNKNLQKKKKKIRRKDVIAIICDWTIHQNFFSYHSICWSYKIVISNKILVKPLKEGENVDH